MRVLVTGSAGLVGSAVARRLRAAGRTVVGVDRLPSAETSVVADLRAPGAWRGALDGVGAVVHTAALHAPHVGVRTDDEFHQVNVGATRSLVAAAAAAGVRRFVLTSSTSVYGHALVPTDAAVWITEETECRPRDIYDETKLAAERLVLDATEAGPMTAACLRIARCFPEPPEVEARHRLYRGVALADVAEAHLLAVEGDAEGVLNVAGPYPWLEEDLKRLRYDPAGLITGRLPEVAAGFARRGWALPTSVDRVYVSARAGALLGYRPRHGVSELTSPGVK
ncbi:NAD-dependent epimerase/dehydratase family protein [Kitasatospora sp. NPDC089509]|uniref:NAD-dependent epimerase/dehydratase family protein n=1 Tax=Kitasatospora sp. NPDC089509 TaxID=3364079 RepID=UPI00382B696C